MKPIGMLGLSGLVIASAVAATRPDTPRPPDPGEPQEPKVDEPIAAPAPVRPVHRVLSPVTGRVAKIAANVGQLVEKGDPLATVEPPDLDMPVTDLHKAEADFIAARHTLRRMMELHSLIERAVDIGDVVQGQYAGGDARALFVIEEPAPDVAWVASIDPTTGTSVVRCVFDDGDPRVDALSRQRRSTR